MSWLADTSISSEIVKMISDIVEHNISSFKDRKEASRKFEEILRNAKIDKEQEISSSGAERQKEI